MCTHTCMHSQMCALTCTVRPDAAWHGRAIAARHAACGTQHAARGTAPHIAGSGCVPEAERTTTGTGMQNMKHVCIYACTHTRTHRPSSLCAKSSRTLLRTRRCKWNAALSHVAMNDAKAHMHTCKLTHSHARTHTWRACAHTGRRHLSSTQWSAME